MQYSLGIDAGGTYTDAVILRDSDSRILDTSKSITTFPDLMVGIRNAIDKLNPEYLKQVKLVSISTTLSTNTILERTGYPVGLILVGDYTVPRELPADYRITVRGGHDSNGDELHPLDLAAVEQFAVSLKDKVSAFAVSSYFSTRNPEHELKVKQAILKLTGHPVVCGHELSQELGAYERAATAILNAQLIPITYQFIHSIMEEVKKRKLDAKILMLKCDGSVIDIESAKLRPIETIFSGPAASVMGASYLSGLDTCAVIDVGGTSTDVSLIKKGNPELCEKGAVVGGWQTSIKAIKIESSANGGDSHVWFKKCIRIGPRRVMPLCFAAVQYPNFKEKLEKNPVPLRTMLNEHIQPTKFFVSTGINPINLTESERKLLEYIKDEPLSIHEILNKMRRFPSPAVLDSLIQQRAIQAIGFTPTDALHVLGEYTEWDVEAAQIGAKKLSRFTQMGTHAFCKKVKQQVAKNMVYSLMSFIMEGRGKDGIKKLLEEEIPVQYKLNIPVVMLGGPVKAYYEEIKALIDAEIIVPEHARVGNAVGALVGKGIKRIEITIRPSSMENPDQNFLVFTPAGREKFEQYQMAVEYSHKVGEELILDSMKDFGLPESSIKIDTSVEYLSPPGWKQTPMETRIVFVGTCTPGVITY
ncbi:N-methylhydantoinase A/oxoprolinase/acetone carboxylase, beta subunit [Methanosarcina thermophila]|jgi:N-methylhydantoinase A/oxoprolinase/acetone carboxylase beta subunit|uniref:Hydantoinase n=3 Tax=Methanosarcina thermophila TaxID=2210 RepID=A0A1I6X1M7_METTE|nr:hydantoinase/oxoprolinase family protein [Methanosarcina thermophila]AKB13505.1 Hydantoinase [Methanosarcina thermophila TM-1]AKB15860.1 Hydantoinase [Methanosarcina thermophila CHTI-55]NLU56581.1 hydantoinase/oxoprolinase family protein [Methanosarcina thermophila]SFT32126.1 N-methylhydantoinase A/oxoprolinase/acetone carboxylase, beta subunit [Methanosarcina thermophila]BAW28512.1 hydantoinase [Methanosarcina thermophila]